MSTVLYFKHQLIAFLVTKIGSVCGISIWNYNENIKDVTVTLMKSHALIHMLNRSGYQAIAITGYLHERLIDKYTENTLLMLYSSYVQKAGLLINTYTAIVARIRERVLKIITTFKEFFSCASCEPLMSFCSMKPFWQRYFRTVWWQKKCTTSVRHVRWNKSYSCIDNILPQFSFPGNCCN